jgi:hypothetical protein
MWQADLRQEILRRSDRTESNFVVESHDRLRGTSSHYINGYSSYGKSLGNRGKYQEGN